MGKIEQVHMIGGYSDEVTVVFTTPTMSKSRVHVRKAVDIPKEAVVSGTAGTYASLITPGGWNGYADDWNHPGENFPACSDQHPQSYSTYDNETCIYMSDVIHTVRLKNLEPGTQYEFRPWGSQ